MTPGLYVEVDELPLTCQPAWVVRDEGATLVVVDPWADRYALLRRLDEQLERDELDDLLEHFGWRDGQVPWAWLRDRGPIGVPERLWLLPDLDVIPESRRG